MDSRHTTKGHQWNLNHVTTSTPAMMTVWPTSGVAAVNQEGITDGDANSYVILSLLQTRSRG
jgi:hypothetical protein